MIKTNCCFLIKQNKKYDKVKCEKCPVGGVCKNGRTTGRGNMFGFKKNNTTINYLPCSSGYCCVGEDCISYDSCVEHRDGIMCGECKDGFQENIFSDTNCMKTKECKHSIWFWILFDLSSIGFVFTFAFLKTLLFKAMQLVKYIKLKFFQLIHHITSYRNSQHTEQLEMMLMNQHEKCTSGQTKKKNNSSTNKQNLGYTL